MRNRNAAHKKLSELEAAGKLTGVVTQNIDGLHQAAGSKHVMELHGSVHRNYCMKCHRFLMHRTCCILRGFQNASAAV